MKKISAFCFLLSALWATAQPSNPPPSVTLGWDPSLGYATNVAGYWLWQGTNTGTYVRALFVPGGATATATLTNVVRGQTYFWNITAQGTNSANGLESIYDGEVTARIPTPPAPAGNLKIVP